VTKPNPENYKNCSSQCAYNCTASVHNTTQNSTVLIIISLLPPDKHHSSDAVYRRRGTTPQ